MVCRSCGKKISSEGISFCPHCGSYLRDMNASYAKHKARANTKGTVSIITAKKEKNDKKDIFIYLFVLLLWGVALYMILQATNEDYYFKDNNIFDTNNNTPNAPEEDVPSAQIGNSVTVIKYDNKYLKQYYISSIEDVKDIIVSDSVNQKHNCPNDMISLETEFIKTYGITAVNLCEMDMDFARELRNVVNYVYNNYPNSRDHLTNLTLGNVTNGSYMAAFIPISTFATNNNNSGYPMGVKSMILLNAKYFLDTNRINSSVSYGVSSGYFPNNATRSSTVAHEFGHYLSFMALLKHYNTKQITFVRAGDSNTFFNIYDDFNQGAFSYRIINEAYNTYKMTYTNELSFEQFRASISQYAVAKDNEGNYIYDETIAEAFHDVYLNGDNAALASKLVMNSLKGYL